MPDGPVLTLRRDPNGRPIRAHPLEDGRGRIGWVPRPDEPRRERLRAEEASLPPRKKGYVAAGNPLPDVDAGREADDRVLAVAENAQRVIDRLLPFVMEPIETRQAAARIANAAWKEARSVARDTAGRLWGADDEQEYSKSDMLTWVSAELKHQGHKVPSEETLWRWIKGQPPKGKPGEDGPDLRPEYVTRPGRRRN